MAKKKLDDIKKDAVQQARDKTPDFRTTSSSSKEDSRSNNVNLAKGQNGASDSRIHGQKQTETTKNYQSPGSTKNKPTQSAPKTPMQKVTQKVKTEATKKIEEQETASDRHDGGRRQPYQRGTGKLAQSLSSKNGANVFSNNRGRRKVDADEGTIFEGIAPTSKEYKDAVEKEKNSRSKNDVRNPMTALQAAAHDATMSRIGIRKGVNLTPTRYDEQSATKTFLNNGTNPNFLNNTIDRSKAVNQMGQLPGITEIGDKLANSKDRRERHDLLRQLDYAETLSPFDRTLDRQSQDAIYDASKKWKNVENTNKQIVDSMNEINKIKENLNSQGLDSSVVDPYLADMEKLLAQNRQAQTQLHSRAELVRAGHGYFGGEAGDEYNAYNLSGEEAKRTANEIEGEVRNLSALQEAARRAGNSELMKYYGGEVKNLQKQYAIPESWDVRAQNALLSGAYGIIGGLRGFGELAGQSTYNATSNANNDNIMNIRNMQRYYQGEYNKAVARGDTAEARRIKSELDRYDTLLNGTSARPDSGYLHNDIVDPNAKGQEWLRKSEEYMAKAEIGANAPTKFALETLSAGMEMIPQTAAFLINPALGVAYTGASVMGQQGYQFSNQLDANGNHIFPSAQEAFLKSIPYAAVEIVTEKLGIDKVGELVSSRAGRGMLATILGSAVAEGGEEGVSGVLQNALDLLYGDPAKIQQFNSATSEEQFEMIKSDLLSVLPQMASGAILGGAIGGVGHAVGSVLDGKNAQVLQTQAVQQEIATQANNQNEANIDYLTAAARAAAVAEPGTSEGADSMHSLSNAVNRMSGGVTPVEPIARVGSETAVEKASPKEMPTKVADIRGQGKTDNSNIVQFPGSKSTQTANASANTSKTATSDNVVSIRQEAESRIDNNERIARNTDEPYYDPELAVTTYPSGVSVSDTKFEAITEPLGVNGKKGFKKAYDGETDVANFYSKYAPVYRASLNGKKPDYSTKYGLTESQFATAIANGKADRLAYDTTMAEKSLDAVKNSEAGITSPTDMSYAREVYGDTATVMNDVAKSLGLKLSFATNIKGNGYVNGTNVVIGKENKEPVQFILGHEITHRMQELAPEAYNKFRDWVMADDTQIKRAQKLMNLYNSQNVKIGEAEAVDEVVADYAGAIINNHDLLSKFLEQEDVKQNPSLIQRMIKALKQLVAKITGVDLEDYKKRTNGAIDMLTDAYNEAVKRNEALENWDSETYPQGPVVEGASEEAIINNDANIRYKISNNQDVPEEYIGKMYKAFALFEDKPGELFSAMVEFPGGHGTPQMVWSDADSGKIKRDKDKQPVLNSRGRTYVKAGGKNVNASGGEFGWRGGLHGGTEPYAKQFDIGNKETGEKKGALFRSNLAWAECDYINEVDYTLEALEYGVNENGVYIHSAGGLPYIPHRGSYMYRTNADPTTSPWIITGSFRINRLMRDSEVSEILKGKTQNKPRSARTEITYDKKGNVVRSEDTKTPATEEFDVSRFGLSFDESLPGNADLLPKEGFDESVEAAMQIGYKRRPIDFDDKNIIKEFDMLEKAGLKPRGIKEGQSVLEYYKDIYEKTNRRKLFEDNGGYLTFEDDVRMIPALQEKYGEALAEFIKNGGKEKAQENYDKWMKTHEEGKGIKKEVKKQLSVYNPDIRDKRYSITVPGDFKKITGGTMFAGGGTLDYALRGLVLNQFAVEYDARIAGVWKDNNEGMMFAQDVRDFTKEYMSMYIGRIQYLHASPVCHNYSRGKNNAKETPLDIKTARAAAKGITRLKPKVFTLENVKGYDNSKAMEIVIRALKRNGYRWDVDVYKASDYGGHTKRERLFLRAVKIDGQRGMQLPPPPQKIYDVDTSWGEYTKDLLADMKETHVPNWMADRLANVEHIDVNNLDENLLVLHGTRGGGLVYAKASETCPTIMANTKDARIFTTDGRVLEVSPEFFRRIQGLPNTYALPKSKTRAFKILGNGIPVELTEAVVGSLLLDTKFSMSSYQDTMNDINNQTSNQKRWTTTPTSDNKAKGYSLGKIVDSIETEFGITLTIGHMGNLPRKVSGYYDLTNEEIRVRLAENLPTIDHELGHALDDKYGLLMGDKPKFTVNAENELKANFQGKNDYPDHQWGFEGFAEFIREYMKNKEETVKKYPITYKELKENITEKDATLLEIISDETNKLMSEPSDTTGTIRTDGEKLHSDGIMDIISDRYEKFYETFVDSNRGINNLSKEAGNRTAYIMANNAAYAASRAANILAYDLYSMDGTKRLGGGLRDALQGVDIGNAETYRKFGEYLVVKHGPERLKEGQRIFADDRANTEADMKRRQLELEREHPEFIEASEKLYAFQESFLFEYGVNSGLISNKSAMEWRERWKNYVPLNRYIPKKVNGKKSAKRGFANQESGISRAKGSGRDILNPVDNIMDFVCRMTTAGIMNNTMKHVVQAVDEVPDGAKWMVRVPAGKNKITVSTETIMSQLQEFADGQNDSDADAIMRAMDAIDDFITIYTKKKATSAESDEIAVMYGGKPQYYKVHDRQLLGALTSMNENNMDGLLRVYGHISRFMTSNITGNNIVWSIFSNLPRDAMTFLTFAKKKDAKSLMLAVKDVASVYVNNFKGNAVTDADFLEYRAMGGGRISAYTADMEMHREVRKEIVGHKSRYFNPLYTLEFLSNIIESGPRFAAYKMAKRDGLTPEQAFYEAMDITTNFARHGTMGRSLNAVFPFFNASVQGIDKFARWISCEDVPKENRSSAVMARFTMYLTCSAILAAIEFGINCMHGDDDRENYNLLSNYTKNTFFCLPMGDAKFFCVPKPREIAIPQSFMVTLLEYMITDNEHAFDDFKGYALDNLLPSAVSSAVTLDLNGLLGSLGILGVGAYMNANKDFLGNPIVSQSMEGKMPKDQYDGRTAKVAVALSKAFRTLDVKDRLEHSKIVSPEMIDFFFSQTLGGFWKWQKALLPMDATYVDKFLGIKNQYLKDAYRSNDIMNWLYEEKEKANQRKNSDGTAEDQYDYKMMDTLTSFYSAFSHLAKDLPNTETNRNMRRTVIDMVLQYRKEKESGKLSDRSKKMIEIIDATGYTDFMPTAMKSVVKDGRDKSYQLSAQQYIDYQTDYLDKYYKNFDRLAGKIDDENKLYKAIKTGKTDAQDAAKFALIKRLGGSTEDEKGNSIYKTGKIEEETVLSNGDVQDIQKALKEFHAVYRKKPDGSNGQEVEASVSLQKAEYLMKNYTNLKGDDLYDAMKAFGVADSVVEQAKKNPESFQRRLNNLHEVMDENGNG